LYCLPRGSSHHYAVLGAEIVFMVFTKIVKLVGLFWRNPSDMIYLPLSVVFGYFHSLIKLRALITLKEVGYTLCHFSIRSY
ncbi:hypothetical protein OQA88_13185, partial [Cercophora sp. LCS_1]